MQRQVAGRSVFAVRKRIAGLLRFFFSHYIIVLPIAIAVYSRLFIHHDWNFINYRDWGTSIASGLFSSIANCTSIFINRLGFCKNSLLFCLALYYSWNRPNILSAGFILYLWCIASLSYILIAILWWWIWNNGQHANW